MKSIITQDTLESPKFRVLHTLVDLSFSVPSDSTTYKRYGHSFAQQCLQFYIKLIQVEQFFSKEVITT